MIKRRILAMFIALSAMFSLTATVHAEDVTETRNTVNIGGYDCWVEDGEYYTEYDGETCQVINLDEITPQPVSEMNLRYSPSSWEYNNVELDISDGREYQGLINIKKYDDFTPIFIGTPNDHDFSYQITTKFIFTNKYSISFFTFDSDENTWSEYLMTVYLGFGSNKKILVSGQATPHTTKCCVYFHKDGSTGEEVFNYWFKQITTND